MLQHSDPDPTTMRGMTYGDLLKPLIDRLAAHWTAQGLTIKEGAPVRLLCNESELDHLELETPYALDSLLFPIVAAKLTFIAPLHSDEIGKGWKLSDLFPTSLFPERDIVFVDNRDSTDLAHKASDVPVAGGSDTFDNPSIVYIWPCRSNDGEGGLFEIRIPAIAHFRLEQVSPHFRTALLLPPVPLTAFLQINLDQRDLTSAEADARWTDLLQKFPQGPNFAAMTVDELRGVLIEDAPLSLRTKQSFRNSGIATLGQFIDTSEENMKDITGELAIFEIKTWLSELRLN